MVSKNISFPNFKLGLIISYFENDDIEKGKEFLESYLKNNSDKNISSDIFFDILYKKFNEYNDNEDYENALLLLDCITSSIDTKIFDKYLFWKKAAFCCQNFKSYYLALECYKQCLKFECCDKDIYRIMGDILFFDLDRGKESIEYYEEYIKYIKNNQNVYNVLGHLYEHVYKSEFVDKQIEYFKKAIELAPKEISFRRNLGLVAGRNSKTEIFKENYDYIIKNNPTECDYFDYACWGLKNKCFDIAHEYFWHRFYKETGATEYDNLTYKLWDRKTDLKNKILLLKYEQGYGDTIMFSRFLPEFQKTAPNLIVQVQNSICGLIQKNFQKYNIRIVPESEEISDETYDFQFPMMEMLSYLKITDETIPFKDKYIDVDPVKTAKYKEKYIKTDKLKVGIAYHGHPDYTGDNREIPINLIAKIAEIPNIQLYNLQLSNNADFLSHKKCKNVIDLSTTFKDFEQTAIAMKNMDIIISTDNVLLNLAGAMGLKTMGLFNYYTDYRWYNITENSTGWYNSIKVYRAEKYDEFNNIINKVIKDISKIANKEK